MTRNQPTRPNVILIVADDMGYGDFGVFSEGMVHTPNLDRLVDEGVCFTQHYAGSPICSPSRACLLTGRYPHRTGAITQHDLFGLDRIALREATIADTFQAAGYRTGLIGKWHNGSLDSRYEPNARGFQEFSGFCGGWSDYYDWHLQRNSSISGGDGRYLTDVLTEEAGAFIDRNRDDEFFLMLAYSAPHSPFQAPSDVVSKYLARGFGHTSATTYAMIEVMDRGIGQLLDQLEERGLAENTVVMFTSDNGPAFFNPAFMLQEGEATFQERFNAGLRGSKGWIYDGGIRVPMVVRYPQAVAGGISNSQLVHFSDWLPTLAGLCGIAKVGDASLDGDDLSPLLCGEPISVRPRRFWQWNYYYPDIGTNAAVRDGDWKLVRPMIAGTRSYENPALFADTEAAGRTAAFIEADMRLRADPMARSDLLPIPNIKLPPAEPLELYNLADDPGETTDLADANPGLVSRMLCELETWFESVEADRLSIGGPVHGPLPASGNHATAF